MAHESELNYTSSCRFSAGMLLSQSAVWDPVQSALRLPLSHGKPLQVVGKIPSVNSNFTIGRVSLVGKLSLRFISL